MSGSGPNLAASIHQRLLHVARSTGQDFQQLLTRFAIERLLVRLVESQHADDFTLKGALLFVIWVDEPYRPTVDLDLLGHGSMDEDRLRQVFADLAKMKRDDDALIFDAASLAIRRIRECERRRESAGFWS
ncbi:MAG: nucleotidyl transferase AbiEii/AbiGii toxin family protein [Planctomycetota bacterium]